MEDVEVVTEDRAYLRVAAALLIILGAFELLFSLISLFLIAFSPKLTVAGEYGLIALLSPSESYLSQALAYGYVLFHIFLGWLVGLLTIHAGRECMQGRNWKFVYRMVVLSWIYFPAGTTVGLMVWRDLRREEVRRLFRTS